LFREVSLFSRDEQPPARRIIQAMQKRRLSNGRNSVYGGAGGKAVFIIRSGRVELSRVLPDGKPRALGHWARGSSLERWRFWSRCRVQPPPALWKMGNLSTFNGHARCAHEKQSGDRGEAHAQHGHHAVVSFKKTNKSWTRECSRQTMTEFRFWRIVFFLFSLTLATLVVMKVWPVLILLYLVS